MGKKVKVECLIVKGSGKIVYKYGHETEWTQEADTCHGINHLAFWMEHTDTYDLHVTVI